MPRDVIVANNEPAATLPIVVGCAVSTFAEAEVKLTADALDISGIEYVRVNTKPIKGNTKWNLYVTHNRKAGNPQPD